VAALYAWLRRHPKLVDGVLATVLLLTGIAPAVTLGRPALIPLSAVMCVPVVFRRAHPVGAFAVAVAAGAVEVALGLRPGTTGLALVVLLYTLAAYTPRRVSIAGLAVCLCGIAVAIGRWWTPGAFRPLTWLFVGSVTMAGPALIAWVVGDSMRYRRAYYANLEERAARLEAERDTQAQIAAAAERARIARELHDVVAHHVSVMVVQADGATYALGHDPQRARTALAAIGTTGRQALAEMRRLLGVLRADEDAAGAQRAPLPGIGQLADLLEQSRAAGLPVSLTVAGVPQPLPDGTGLAAYRIVQESLTNARKHAGPHASAEVKLCYEADALVLTIIDDGRGGGPGGDGTGHGLAGMAERVGVYGGTLTAGPRGGGGFEVAARIPLARAVAAAP
jgi:signal transduction histidine kinase